MGWDANTESDLAGYRVFSSTFSLLGVTTTAASGISSVQKSTVGVVTQTDMVLVSGVTRYFRLTAFDTSGNQSEFNVDGSSQPAVLVVLIKPGDMNNDGRVGITDLSILLSNYGSTDPRADINNSGRVDLTDLSLLLSNWGTP